jgi:uncharacterized cupin superfamily protein
MLQLTLGCKPFGAFRIKVFHTHRHAMTAEDLRAKLIRNIDSVPLESYERAPLYASRTGDVTARDGRQLGASLDVVPPGKRSCPYHFHWGEEEMFVILAGQATLRVAGELLPVKTGDVISIPAGPDYPHQLINTGSSDLKVLSISTQQRPEICEYPDSGKLAAFPGPRGESLIQRHSESLDYWSGEP